MRVVACLLMGLTCLLRLARAQTRAEYIGGTVSQLAEGTQGSITLTDDRYLAFYAGKTQIRVAYDRVDLVEYDAIKPSLREQILQEQETIL